MSLSCSKSQRRATAIQARVLVRTDPPELPQLELVTALLLEDHG